jgi:purine-nucleoside phosphorylase
MSLHIEAKAGEIAETVLMPGDPLRAKNFAETLLEDAVCFNNIRGMLGYSGFFQGKKVSIMGSGMGIPTLQIYVHELLAEYGVKTIIRVGTCGALRKELRIGDLVLAMSASTDSHINKLRFNGQDYAPTADFGLLLSAYNIAISRGVDVKVGSILSSDTFYHDDDETYWKKWADFGALVVEMETAGLYTLAAKFYARALSILTVSDSLVSHESAPSQMREKGYSAMAEIALAAAQ